MKAVSPCHVILEQWAIGVCLCVNEWASERHIAEILDKSTIKCNHVFTLANKQRACGSLEKTNNNFNVVIQKQAVTKKHEQMVRVWRSVDAFADLLLSMIASLSVITLFHNSLVSYGSQKTSKNFQFVCSYDPFKPTTPTKQILQGSDVMTLQES